MSDVCIYSAIANEHRLGCFKGIGIFVNQVRLDLVKPGSGNQVYIVNVSPSCLRYP